MLSILQMCPQPTIDILKIDIEGSEATLFDASAKNWLKFVRNFCVEIHSMEALVNVEEVQLRLRTQAMRRIQRLPKSQSQGAQLGPGRPSTQRVTHPFQSNAENSDTKPLRGALCHKIAYQRVFH
jgi:hypothetical protein